MAQYKMGLKSKVLDTLMLVEDFKSIRDLIDKVVKINNKKFKLTTLFNKIIYAKMHLIGKPLKSFQLYLLKIQTNGVTTTNKKMKYIFSL